MKDFNVVILVSGRGSNMKAIIDAVESGDIKCKISCVISNVPNVKALDIAKEHGIRAEAIDNKKYASRKEYETELLKLLKSLNPDLICLAGYMLILGKEIVNEFKGKIINIHPALLPSFPGLNAQQQALDYGVKITGCTVHFVDEGCDTGPIIAQKAIEILPGDTLATLSARILEEEHRLYPEAIKILARL